MRCLVTGGAGFIGSHLTRGLLAAGHDVRVLDDLSTGRIENVPPEASFRQLDITQPAVAPAIVDYAPEAVFHLAAQIDVRQSVSDPAQDARINVEGTVRVARASAPTAGCFLFASSGGAIYGEQVTFPADETHPTRPASPYGVAKLCAETYLAYFGRQHPLRVVSLRLANVYGPRQDPHGEAGVVAIFAHRMLRGEPPIIHGDGKQTRDYVFVEDVVAAFETALARNVSGAFNIGTGVETDVNTLARRLAPVTGYQGAWTHDAAQPGEQRRSCLTVDRARRELDWRPRVDLTTGLARTVASWKPTD